MSSRFAAFDPDKLDTTEFGLAYAENASLPEGNGYGTQLGGPHFAGANVDATTLPVKFTRVGDVDLDDLVNFSDSILFGSEFDDGATSNRYWFEGDFDYDGFVEFNDLVVFNGAYDDNMQRLPAPPVLGVDGSWNVTVNESETITVTGTYADVNGDTVTFINAPTGFSHTGTSFGTWTWTYTPTGGPQAAAPITIAASDGDAEHEPTERTILFSVGPAAPDGVTATPK